MTLVLLLLPFLFYFTYPQSCKEGSYYESSSCSCLPCPQGFYCPGSVTPPQPCPAGTFNNLTSSPNLTFCLPCPSGYYSDQPGHSSCLACPQGYFCNTTLRLPCPQGTFSTSLSTECTLCPLGSYCPFLTSLPIQCPLGTYSNVTGLMSCIECPEGFYSVTSGNINCTRCPPGSYCVTSLSTPTVCPRGYFSGSGQKSCGICGIGYFSEPGSTGCTECPEGYYCPSPFFSPIKCPKGTYSNSTKGIVCSVCEEGYYSDVLGSVNCSLCPVGGSCVDKSAWVECPLGTYGVNGVCNVCPEGYWCTEGIKRKCRLGTVSSKGSSECGLCGIGEYINEGECVGCPENYDCSNSSDIVKCDVVGVRGVCFGCSYNQFFDGNRCKNCLAGYKCLNNTLIECEDTLYSYGRDNECSTCPQGFISAKTNCYPCGYGQYCIDNTINNCPLGTYNLEKGRTSCTDCPRGYYCPNSTTLPILCSEGYYSSYNQTQCDICTKGYKCVNNVRIQCNDDEYSMDYQMNCLLCPEGKQCVDKQTLIDCQQGYYSRLAEVNCTICPAGYSCLYPDIEPVLCEKGFWSNQGSVLCNPIEKGKFGNTTAMDFAGYECELGYYTNFEASTECLACFPGYFCNKTDEQPRYLCKAGYYSSQGAYECSQCPRGYACPNTKISTPIRCDQGTYSLGRQVVCFKCPRGYYCNGTDINLCPLGSYSLSYQSQCVTCPAGYYCNDQTILPVICPNGYWSEINSTQCNECLQGYYCVQGSTSSAVNICPDGYYCSTATSTPIKCPSGTYGDGEGKISLYYACKGCPESYYCPPGVTLPLLEKYLCPPGHYCPANVSYSTQYPCGVGYYNPDTGSINSSACLTCPNGYLCYSGTKDYTLNPCPSGYYCENGVKIACPRGTFNYKSGLSNVTQCQECPAGYYCDDLPTISPKPCVEGSYNPNSGSTSDTDCVLCPAGTSCRFLATKEPEMNSCTEGHYCLEGTSDDGSECPSGTFTHNKNSTQLSDCEICYEGFACYIGTGGLRKSMVACARGYYCPGAPFDNNVYTLGMGYEFGTNDIHQNPCPAGTYSNKTHLTKVTECTQCPSGYYCTGQLTEPDGECSPGYYCPIASTSPTQVACPEGTYSPYYGLEYEYECVDCPLGKYCTGVGQTEITGNCSPGSYGNKMNLKGLGPSYDTDSDNCIYCPAGYKCPNYAQVSPVECTVGYYSDSEETECEICPKGHYCPDNSTTYQNMTNNYICSAGLFCDEGMRYEPTLLTNACPVSKYCLEGSTDPTNCPEGTYGPNTGLKSESECTECPKGYYCLEGVYSVSGECAVGHYCPAGSSSPTQNECPSRTYRDLPGGSSIESCFVCERGYYCLNGTSELYDCPRGYYCDAGISEPVPCPDGKFSNSTNLKGIEFCTDCPAGQYCDSTFLDQPTGLCDAGYFCIGRSSSPTPSNGICPIGGYCEEGSKYPSSCAEGTYGNNTGLVSSSECINCTEGYYCYGSNNPEPTDFCYPGYYCTGGAPTPIQNSCSSGYFCPLGSSEPQECNPGTYNAHYNRSECTQCPAGYYCPGYGMTTFTDYECPKGKYCEEGTITPKNCRVSTFSNLTKLINASQCIPCLPGRYCDALGLIHPKGLCDPGYYCLEGSSERNPISMSYGDECPEGFYCQSGTYKPDPCPIGTYLPFKRQANVSACINCPAGYYCNEIGLTNYSGKCDEGYYCNSGSFSKAPTDGVNGDICPKGFYCPLGSSSPQNCDPGYYNTRTTQSECHLCPRGYFCNSTTIYPYICPRGGFCIEGIDNTNIQLCPKGTFSNQYGLYNISQCQLCPAGKVCSEEGLIEPDGECNSGIYCEKGVYSVDGNFTEGGFADICPQGYYCESGAKHFYPCPIGTFSPNEGLSSSSECLDCPPGQYCETPGLSSPTGDCSAGYYCTLGAIVSTPTDNNVTGDICPKGFFCESGTSLPEPCHAGSFANELGKQECDICTMGYYCVLGSIEPLPCQRGYYCLEGTNSTQYECPKGSFSNSTKLSSKDQCQLCNGGEICTATALTSPDGDCPEGYYCLRGCVDGGVVGELGGESEICPKGHYCPFYENEVPSQCPQGTYLDVVGSSSIEDCIQCPPGKYCETSGLIEPTGNCSEGYFCINGSITATPIGGICPKGFFCESGVFEPTPCPEGTFSNELGRVFCEDCPQSYFCPQQTIIPQICSRGYYCQNNTGSDLSECPSGSFSNLTGLSRIDDCSLCSPGKYCETPGLVEPTGDCLKGYYCMNGAKSSTGDVGELGGKGGICTRGYYCPVETSDPLPCPSKTYNGDLGIDSVSGCTDCTPGQYCLNTGLESPSGWCEAGYYCPSKSTHSREIICPKGYRCPSRSSTPLLCTGSTYQNKDGSSECLDTPPGYYRYSNMEIRICPIGKYCIEGESYYCPNGSYGLNEGYVSSANCPLCLPGRYCQNGEIIGDCKAGYICHYGNGVPNPISTDEGDLCPIGYYCLEGASDPTKCPPGTITRTKGGSSSDSCSKCYKGYYCPVSSLGEIVCPPGFYCDQNETFNGMDPVACPLGTYNPFKMGDNLSSCIPCAEGYYCPIEGLSNVDSFPCLLGHYCPSGSINPYKCPPGTYRNTSKGIDVENSCHPCDRGYYCPQNGSISPTECSEGRLCAEKGRKTEELCPGGFYCLKRSYEAIECPAGHYCPEGSSSPILCTGNVYCLKQSVEPTLCPGGYTGKAIINLKTSFKSSCQKCLPGTYANRYTNNKCEKCSSGHVCLEGCVKFNPTNISLHGGFVCPKGHYCVNGTGPEPVSCPIGFYNDKVGMNKCSICPAGSFQDVIGQDHCKKCGKSSYSLEGASTCICNGSNRIYQVSDGSCVCKEGYVFYDSNNVVSTSDSIYPCIDIIYERCGLGYIRNVAGVCVEKRSINDNCETTCENGEGEFDYNLGICICKDSIVNEDDICDEDCRSSQYITQYNPETRKYEVYDPLTEQIVSSYSLSSLSSGQVECTKRSKCNLNVIRTSSSGFEGIYNTQTDYISNLFNKSLLSSIDTSRRYIESNIEDDDIQGVSQPIVCLEYGDGLIWDLSGDNGYPTYVRDTLIANNNENFDYGQFRKLQSYIENNVSISTFVFTFKEPGTFIFGLSSDHSKIMIVKVMNEHEQCSDSSVFKSLTTQNLVKSGISKNEEDNIFLSPDWILIIVLLFGLFAFIIFFIASVHYFRTSTFHFSTGNARPKLPTEIKNKIVGEKITAVDIYNRNNDDGEDVLITLDNFSIEKFYYKLDQVQKRFKNLYKLYNDDFSKKYSFIFKESSIIKDMILKRPDMIEISVMINVKQHLDKLSKNISGLEKSEDFYDEKCINNIFDELNEKVKYLSLPRKHSLISKVLSEKEKKRLDELKSKEDMLKKKTIKLYQFLINKLKIIDDKMKDFHQEDEIKAQPEAVKKKILSEFGNLIHKAEKNISKNLNAINNLKILQNEITNSFSINISERLIKILSNLISDIVKDILKKYGLFNEDDEDDNDFFDADDDNDLDADDELINFPK